MTVLICVPTYETICTETYKSLWEQEDCDQDLMFDTIDSRVRFFEGVSFWQSTKTYKSFKRRQSFSEILSNPCV